MKTKLLNCELRSSKKRIVVISLWMIPLYGSIHSAAYAETNDDKALFLIDKAVYGTDKSLSQYEELIDTLSNRCLENKGKIGDLAIAGTEILREHRININNYQMLGAITTQTKNRSGLSCANEIARFIKVAVALLQN